MRSKSARQGADLGSGSTPQLSPFRVVPVCWRHPDGDDAPFTKKSLLYFGIGLDRGEGTAHL